MAEEAWGEESTWDQPEAEAPAAEDTTLVPAADNTGGANEFPDAAPKIVEKTLEELKDEAGAWTLASDESVSAPVACLFTTHTYHCVLLQLRLYLTNYSERMMGRTKEIAKSVDDLLQDTEVPCFCIDHTVAATREKAHLTNFCRCGGRCWA